MPKAIPTSTPNASLPQTIKMKTSHAVIVAVVCLLLFIVALGAIWYFYRSAQKAKQYVQETEASMMSKEEIDQLVEKVGRHLVLPEGETPTIATVTNPEALRGQPFFAQAKAGDIVLIYTQAGKAILYDPVADKIVDIAPVAIGDSTGGEETSTP